MANDFASDIESQVAEHAMRVSSDLHLVAELLSCLKKGDGFESALGRVLSESNKPLRSRTPLACVIDGTVPDDAWRGMVQNVPSSLWSELETMRSIYGENSMVRATAPKNSADTNDAYNLLHPLLAEVVELRSVTDADLMGLD